MFVNEGIKAVRMDDIAHSLAISKRTLYEVFSDRKELVRHCIDHYFHSVDSASGDRQQLADENVFECVWQLVVASNEFRKTGSFLVQQLVRYYPDLLQDFLYRHHEEMKCKLQKMIAEGKVQGFVMAWIDDDYFSRAITNYLYGLNLIESNTHITGTKTDEKSFPVAVAVFLRGIATDKGRDYIDRNLLNVAE